MARFDVYQLLGVNQLVVDVQSELLAERKRCPARTLTAQAASALP